MNWRAIILGAALATLAAVAASAQTHLYTVQGNSIGDRYGIALGRAGDVNADGVPDFVLGSPFDGPSAGNGPGVARVYSGLDGSLLHAFNGASAGDYFGVAVDGAGDVDGDGYDDIIVGISKESTNAVLAGAVRVYSGQTGLALHTILGTTAYGQFGVAVSGLGDIDGDGLSDFAVGESENHTLSSGTGHVHVYSGGTGSLIATLNGQFADDAFGSMVDCVGDVDRDGTPDLIVGAPLNDNNGAQSGNARVFSGATLLPLYSIDGDQAGAIFGIALAGAGDVNRDGYDDFAVGAPGTDGAMTDTGRVKVFSGFDGSILWTFDGLNFRDQLGYGVAGPGDVNGDGYDDIAITLLGRASQPLDTAIVKSGRDGTDLHVLTGAFGSLYGSQLEGVGDVNGDGFADLLLGAPSADGAAPDAGSAFLIQMPTLEVLSFDGLGGHGIQLDWIAAGTSGQLSGSLASPFGTGLYVASLAEISYQTMGLELLVAIDGTNLVSTGSFAFDGTGSHLSGNISRMAPAIAGARVHIQWFEAGPQLRSSNGIRILMVP